MTYSDFELGSGTVRCTTLEIAVAFEALLAEMLAADPVIRTDESDVLRRSWAARAPRSPWPRSNPNSCASRPRTRPRGLRTAVFVRPAGRDLCDRAQRIMVRPFARIAWDQLGAATIFGNAPNTDDIDLRCQA